MFNSNREEKKAVAFWLSERTEAGIFALKRRIESDIGKSLTHDEFMLGLLKYCLIARRDEVGKVD